MKPETEIRNRTAEARGAEAMTPLSIEEMERLEKAAPEGPWEVVRLEHEDGDEWYARFFKGGDTSLPSRAAVEFIVVARAFVPWAIEQMRAKDREIEELREKTEDRQERLETLRKALQVVADDYPEAWRAAEQSLLDAAKGTKP